MKRGLFTPLLALFVCCALPVLSADYQTGVEAFEKGEYARAIAEFTALAEDDNFNAQYTLGQMYENGLGVNADIAKAADWYLRAANLGQAEAQLRIAELYESGQGVPQDLGKAVRWYLSAAEQGLGQAEYRLGKAYSQGQGITQNDLQAEIWLRRAANHGVPDAQFMLGERLFYVSIPPHNNAEAYMWMRAAAALGLEKAARKKRFYAIFMTPNQLVEGEEMFLDWWAEYNAKPTVQ